MDTSLFPIGMEKHIIFAVVAGIFFLLQFFRTKYWYELILAVAVPFSLLVYVNKTSTVWFYAVGIIEAALLLFALLTYAVQYRKIKKQENAKKAAQAAEKAETEPTA